MNKRNKYDYRKKYMEHNHGIFGYYICYMCFKPVAKDEMEVDHIIPLAKGGPNHIINCVSSCRNCNRSKSDKLDSRVYRGVIFKIVEELILFVRKVLRSVLILLSSVLTAKNKIVLYFLAVVLICLMLF